MALTVGLGEFRKTYRKVRSGAEKRVEKELARKTLVKQLAEKMILNEAEMNSKLLLLALFHLQQPILDQSEVKEENVEPVLELEPEPEPESEHSKGVEPLHNNHLSQRHSLVEVRNHLHPHLCQYPHDLP